MVCKEFKAEVSVYIFIIPHKLFKCELTYSDQWNCILHSEFHGLSCKMKVNIYIHFIVMLALTRAVLVYMFYLFPYKEK